MEISMLYCLIAVVTVWTTNRTLQLSVPLNTYVKTALIQGLVLHIDQVKELQVSIIGRIHVSNNMEYCLVNINLRSSEIPTLCLQY